MRTVVALLVIFSAFPAFAKSKPTGPPEVLFTFDDGPAPGGRTAKILDALEAHHIHAVFFINGYHLEGKSARAAEARQLLRDELQHGMAVGNHTIHHYFLCGHVYSKRATEEVEGNAALIEQATGVRPELFRTPYGSHCKALKATFAELGVHPIGWDIDPQDWRVRNAQKVESYVEHALMRLHGRKILLMHDIQPATVAALPHILDWIDKENARRAQLGLQQIKIIDYSYLLPPEHLVPPLLDALGRVLIGLVHLPSRSPLPVWPLAWMAGQV